MNDKPESTAPAHPAPRSRLFAAPHRRDHTIVLAVVAVVVAAVGAYVVSGLRSGPERRLGPYRLLSTFHNADYGMFSPDGSTLAFGTEHHLRLGYLTGVRRQRELRMPPARSGIGSMVFSHDGRYFAAAFNGDGSGNQIRLWDTRDGATRWTVEQPDVGEIEFSPDDHVLATGGSTVRVWDTGTGRMRFETGAGTPRSTMDFLPDGTLLTVAAGTATVWDPGSGRPERTLDLTGTATRVPNEQRATVVSPDGRSLVTATGAVWRGAAPQGPLQMSLWDVATGTVRYTIPMDGVFGPSALAFSPDGRYFASAYNPDLSSDGTLTMWDTATGARRYTVDDDGVVFSADNRYLATFDGGLPTSQTHAVVLRTLHDGQARRTFPGQAFAVFSPDSRLIATQTGGGHHVWDGSATLWTVPGATKIRVLDHTAEVAFSPNGRRLAAFSRDATRVWSR